MTLYLELPPDVEAQLEAEAAQRGLPKEEYALAKLRKPEPTETQSADAAILCLTQEIYGEMPDEERAKLPPDLAINPVITSQMVLAEFLDGAATRGAYQRTRAVQYVRGLSSLPNVRVVPQSEALFEEGLTLHEQKPDQSWGFTDCTSLVICQREQIRDVLTYDHHFVQMGLNALLRAPAP